jgi:hypothetical protein
MDIGIPIRELGEFDTSALRDAILAQDEAAWHEDEFRQDKYDQSAGPFHDRRAAISVQDR